MRRGFTYYENYLHWAIFFEFTVRSTCEDIRGGRQNFWREMREYVNVYVRARSRLTERRVCYLHNYNRERIYNENLVTGTREILTVA